MSELNGILVVYGDNLYSSQRFYEEAKKLNIKLDSFIENGKEDKVWDFGLFRKYNTETKDFCHKVIHQYNNMDRAHILGSKINQNMMIDIGYPRPKSIIKRSGTTYEEVADILGVPFIAKADISFGGNDVILITQPFQFYNNYERINMFQEYISYSSGRDMRVYVVGGEVVCSIIRANEKDFRSNMKQGGLPTFCNLSQEDKDKCSLIYSKYGLDICGLDLLFNPDGGFMFCEVNSSPGFEGVESETGINIAGSILNHIKNDIKSK